MSTPAKQEPCPFCGEMISNRAARCRFCGEELYEEEDDRPSRRPRQDHGPEPTDFLIPTDVSPWAIGSCYLGLVAFCLPFIGAILGLVAVLLGILALRQRKKKKANSYGSVTSNIRAVIGLILGSLAVVGWGGLFVYLMLHR